MTASPRLGQLSRAIALVCGLAAAILGSALVALFLNSPGVFSTALWPPAGLALAFMLSYGRRALPGIILGAVLIETWLKPVTGIQPPPSQTGWLLAFSIAAGIALQASLGAYLIRKRLGADPCLLDAPSIWQFLKLGGIYSCVVSASVGVSVLLLVDALELAAVPWTWFTWWLGDTFGVFIFTPLTLIVIGQPAHIWRNRIGSVLIPTLFTLLAATTLYALAVMEEREDANHEFERRVSFASWALESKIAKQLEVLHALEGYYNAAGVMDRQSFQLYSRELLELRRGVHGVSWNRVVSPDQRVAFEQAMRKESGDSEFLIFESGENGVPVPAGERERYVVVSYVEPEHGNRAAIGFDAYSDPVRRQAMDKAERDGGLMTTEPLPLLQRPDHPGALVMLPVFANTGWDKTDQAGRGQLLGFLTLILDIPGLVGQALGNLPLDGMIVTIRAELADVTELELYSATFGDPGIATELPNRNLPAQVMRPLLLPGQVWQVTYQPTSALKPEYWLSWTVLVIGLMFVSAAEVFCAVLSGQSITTAELVRQRTQELLKVNEVLRQSEHRFRAVVEQSITGIYVIQGDRFVYVNQQFCDIFGYTEKTILEELKPVDIIDPSHRSISEELVRKRLTGELKYAHYMARGLRADDRKIWIEIHGTRIDLDGKPTITGTILDVTRRREAEQDLEELNRLLEMRVQERTNQIERATRELDAFTYSVSHDLRAPLRGIDGWSLALLEDYGDKLDRKAHEYLGTIRSETRRMGHLIDDMLSLSRATRPDMSLERIDLTEMGKTVADRLLRSDPERRIELSIQPGLIAVCDGRLMEILLTNLMTNAFKFTQTRPTARIEFGRATVVDPDTNTDISAYFVADNGVGFDMKYVDKLFVAFQRFHSASDFPGTGIGLATVQRIVHRHHGKIWAESEVGGGAKFFFTLGDGDAWESDIARGRQS